MFAKTFWQNQKPLILKITLVSVTFLVILAGVFWFLNSSSKPKLDFFSANNSTNSNSNGDQNTSQNTNNQPKKDSLVISAWSPDWAAVSAIDSLNTNQNKLNNFSPVWYDLNENGSLKDQLPDNSTQILATAKKFNLEITPSITCFDHEILTSVLQTPANFDRQLEQIVSLAKNPDYGGIDLDYESTKLTDKDKYFEFLEKLSRELKSLNKHLIVSVLAKWGDEVIYKSLVETRKVQDYARIAKFADEIRIMTYDFGGSASQTPTPIAPLDWQEKVIQYAISQADSRKFSLGQPLYAYEKYVEVKSSKNDLKFNDPNLIFQTDLDKISSSTTPLRAYTFTTVENILNNYKGEIVAINGEHLYKYSKINDDTKILENRVLVFQTQTDLQLRVELAKKYNLKGLSFWRLGGEQDLISGLVF
jgi:spore germination protein YaaH